MPQQRPRRLSCRSTPPRIRRYRLRRRPGFLSPFWVRLSDSQGFTSYREQEEWTLLLSARHLPFRLWKADGRTHCFIPALLRDVAHFEMRLYRQEEAARHAASREPAAQLPVHKGWQWATLAVLPLLAVHAWRSGLLPGISSLPSPSLWEQLGSLDSARLYIYHEGYRCLTALFLHADAAHLYSNVMLSAVALAVAARSLGTGRLWLLTLLGGTLGNALAMLFRTPPYVALGFSTAFFSILGLLCGLARPWRGNMAIPCWRCWERKVRMWTMPVMWAGFWPVLRWERGNAFAADATSPVYPALRPVFLPQAWPRGAGSWLLVFFRAFQL